MTRSRWESARSADRKRPKVTFTLSPATIARIDALAREHGVTKSAVVEAAIATVSADEPA